MVGVRKENTQDSRRKVLNLEERDSDFHLESDVDADDKVSCHS